MGLEYRFEDLPRALAQMHELLIDLRSRIYELERGEKITDDLFDITQAADFLRISVRTLYSKTSKREVPFSKFGKNLFFSRNQLISMVLENSYRSRFEIEKEAKAHTQNIYGRTKPNSR